MEHLNQTIQMLQIYDHEALWESQQFIFCEQILLNNRYCNSIIQRHLESNEKLFMIINMQNLE